MVPPPRAASHCENDPWWLKLARFCLNPFHRPTRGDHCEISQSGCLLSEIGDGPESSRFPWTLQHLVPRGSALPSPTTLGVGKCLKLFADSPWTSDPWWHLHGMIMANTIRSQMYFGPSPSIHSQLLTVHDGQQQVENPFRCRALQSKQSSAPSLPQVLKKQLFHSQRKNQGSPSVVLKLLCPGSWPSAQSSYRSAPLRKFPETKHLVTHGRPTSPNKAPSQKGWTGVIMMINEVQLYVSWCAASQQVSKTEKNIRYKANGKQNWYLPAI